MHICACVHQFFGRESKERVLPGLHHHYHLVLNPRLGPHWLLFVRGHDWDFPLQRNLGPLEVVAQHLKAVIWLQSVRDPARDAFPPVLFCRDQIHIWRFTELLRETPLTSKSVIGVMGGNCFKTRRFLTWQHATSVCIKLHLNLAMATPALQAHWKGAGATTLGKGWLVNPLDKGLQGGRGPM